ncbi:MAG TPA: hypothetical protein VI524_12795 [Anaerolineales bacterium]|nr:hypothetical protein [Anaerolineales bacterium]
MKYFSILTLVLMSTLIISACGAQATPPPTVNVVELQITAAAVALTMIAETQAAIPTATPIPPTETFTDTPAPTNTFPPLPSSEATFTPVPNGNSGGGDPCINQVLPATLVGDPVKIRINNSTKADVSFSIYLNQTTPQGAQSVCGYRAYTISAGQSIVLNDLVEGCYTLWAWNPDPEEYFIVTNGTSCIDNADTWVFDITTGSIRLKT